jgi:hypothetical protein
MGFNGLRPKTAEQGNLKKPKARGSGGFGRIQEVKRVQGSRGFRRI